MKTSIKSLTLQTLFLFCFLSTVSAGPLNYYLQHHQRKQPNLVVSKTLTEQYFDQMIDHKDPSIGSFKQRYYIDATYGKKKNSPVFLYLCGESACTKEDLGDAIKMHAKKYHAIVIALEHRYYGKSLPFKFLSTNDLRYLTTEEALEDIALFQEKMTKKNSWTGKWIAFGGSYPGSLAAYYRLKYPQLVTGALASSAPVRAKKDFFEYDTHVTKVVGPKCANNVRTAIAAIESTLTDTVAFEAIKERFNATEIEDPIDFLSLLADIGASAVQYGDVSSFCDALATGATPLDGYVTFSNQLFAELDVAPVELSNQGFLSTDPRDYKKGNDGFRQWVYQTCTEYGYEQNANPDPSQSTRSHLVNSDYQNQVCERLFSLHKPANTELMNKTYYTPLLKSPASNILFTNGENDPWSTLSLSEKNGNNHNDKLTYLTIEGASHCEDLNGPGKDDSASLIKARKTMHDLLKVWLAD